MRGCQRYGGDLCQETKLPRIGTHYRRRYPSRAITMVHQLEFTNALKQKQFRHELDGDTVQLVLERFAGRKRQGAYFTPVLSWADVLNGVFELSASE
jgi:hypothetical protein